MQGWVKVRLNKGSFDGKAGRACTMNGKIYVTIDSARNIVCFDPQTKELFVHSYLFFTLDEALGMFVMNGVMYLSQTRRLLWYCTMERIWKSSSMVDVRDMVGIVVKGGSDTFVTGDYNFFNILIERFKNLDLNDPDQRLLQTQILEDRLADKEDIERQLRYLHLWERTAEMESDGFYRHYRPGY
jgi:hypothetical protein